MIKFTILCPSFHELINSLSFPCTIIFWHHVEIDQYYRGRTSFSPPNKSETKGWVNLIWRVLFAFCLRTNKHNNFHKMRQRSNLKIRINHHQALVTYLEMDFWKSLLFAVKILGHIHDTFLEGVLNNHNFWFIII